jgi:hypothetical protein
MKAVKKYQKSAPEGVFMARNDSIITLRDVNPRVITELQQHFMAENRGPEPPNWRITVDGTPDGAYYQLIILRGMGAKLPDCGYRFFYRKTSNRTRREAYHYAF